MDFEEKSALTDEVNVFCGQIFKNSFVCQLSGLVALRDAL